MQMHNVNWRDFESVLAYAKHLGMRAPSIMIYMVWDSMGKGRYHITHSRELCGTNTIVAIIGGGDNDNVKE